MKKKATDKMRFSRGASRSLTSTGRTLELMAATSFVPSRSKSAKPVTPPPHGSMVVPPDEAARQRKLREAIKQAATSKAVKKVTKLLKQLHTGSQATSDAPEKPKKKSRKIVTALNSNPESKRDEVARTWTMTGYNLASRVGSILCRVGRRGLGNARRVRLEQHGRQISP
jgi:hypothetical protein